MMSKKIVNKGLQNVKNKNRRTEPIRKNKAIVSLTKGNLQLNNIPKTITKLNSQTDDDISMNLIFTRIDKRKYDQLPKHSIDESKEKRLISILKNGIILNIHLGKYEINTNKPLTKPQSHSSTTKNDTGKYEDYSHSSRNLLSSATTSQLSTGIKPNKITRRVINEGVSNKIPLVVFAKYSAKIKKIPLAFQKNTKMSLSPKSQRDNRMTSPPKIQGAKMNQLKQQFITQKRNKV